MSAAPPETVVFAPTADAYGPRLALVFGNHAPSGVCPWHAAGRCHHCDIGAGEGHAFDRDENRARLAWYRERHAALLPSLAHLVLYDSGSVLNPVELPPDLLDELLAFARGLPSLRVVSLDTREPFVTEERLRHVASVLGPRVQARPTLGLEAADERIREGLLDKRMPRAAVARAFAAAGSVAAELGSERIGVDANVLVGAPGTTAETLAADAAATARWALELGREARVGVDLNLHAYYPSARGLARAPGHPRCSIAGLVAAVRAVDLVRRELAPGTVLFLGWQDEGHDREPELRAGELARAREAFDRFNRTQELGTLDGLRG